MIKTKLSAHELKTILNLLICCRVAVESQYQAGVYPQENYDKFQALVCKLARIQQSQHTHFGRYLSEKEKVTFKKCLKIGVEAAISAYQANRISAEVLENMNHLYQELQSSI